MKLYISTGNSRMEKKWNGQEMEFSVFLERLSHTVRTSETMEQYRSKLKDKKRIVVKIGSSSLQHPQTGELDYIKLEVLVRELCNLRNQGKDVVLVTSGAIAQGRRPCT